MQLVRGDSERDRLYRDALFVASTKRRAYPAQGASRSRARLGRWRGRDRPSREADVEIFGAKDRDIALRRDMLGPQHEDAVDEDDRGIARVDVDGARRPCMSREVIVGDVDREPRAELC